MIIRNCELHFVKLVPGFPNAHFNKVNPTWEVQIRTTDRKQRDEWKEANLSVKAVEDEETGKIYYRAVLKKKSIDAKGRPAKPVEVVNGAMQPVDPKSIGNGSIANLNIFQYEYTSSETGKKGIASMLMGVQITKHVLYVPKERETFGTDGYEVVHPDGAGEDAFGQDNDVPFEVDGEF
jgi:hypothetical protein